jgi:hypothetical protein
VTPQGPITEILSLGEAVEAESMLQSAFLIHFRAPWRASGTWTPVFLLVLVVTILAGALVYGLPGALLGVVAAVPALLPAAGPPLLALVAGPFVVLHLRRRSLDRHRAAAVPAS